MTSPTNGTHGSPYGTFSACLEFAGAQAVVAVSGDIDIVTAPQLRAVVDAVIDRRHRSIVLDMGDVDFIDAAGLGVLADGARRAKASGGSLAIRRPSPMLTRMLEITGLDGLVRIDLTQRHTRELAAEHTTVVVDRVVNRAAGAPRPGLTHHLRKATSVPADEDVVDGTLRLVTALAHATVGGADGVSVSLRRHGVLSTVAATDATILEMDASQYATDEGPCVDASAYGERFHAAALEEERRWPSFTPRARSLGINAILSSPLMSGDEPIGALNIYSRTPHVFIDDACDLSALFAAEASQVLADTGASVTDDRLSDRLQRALRDRELIAQAQGVLMHRYAATEDEAYDRLRDEPGLPHRTMSLRAEDVLIMVRPVDLTGAPGAQQDVPPQLEQFRRDAGLSRGELWMRYFELGGMSTALQLEGFLHGSLVPLPHDHDIVALALNEHFEQIGRGRPVPYLVGRDAS